MIEKKSFFLITNKMPTSPRQLNRMRARRANQTDEEKKAAREADKLRMRRLRAARKLERERTEGGARQQQPTRPRTLHSAAGGRSLTTEQQQQNRVYRVARALDKDYIPNGQNTWLNNTSQVIEHIMQKYDNADSRRSSLSAIVRELGNSSDVPENVIKAYRDKMKDHILAIETRVGENTRTDADKAVWMEWPEIKKKAKDVKKWNDPLMQTIFGLYVALPPRHTDYNDMKVREYSTRAYQKYSPIENVLWKTRGMKRIKMISLSKYKGSDQKGIYTTAKSKDGSHGAKMPALVANPLTKLVTDKGEGDFVFPERYRNPQAFAKLVGDTFDKATGKRITINVLRKIWVTNELRKNPNQNRKKELVRYMGTSIRMFDSSYNKTGDGESKEGN
jgi:hypothetical protein